MAVCLDYQAVYFRKHRSAILSWRWTILGCVFFVTVLSLKVSTRLQITSLGYQLHENQSRALQLDQERRDLEYQVSVLTRLDNIQREAHKRLGMTTVKKAQVRHIE
jgi:cell division protein FtsL